jgi:rod shape determining protein RodA
VTIAKLLRQDLVITFCIILLGLISLVAVYSTTFYYDADIQSNFGKQFGYLIVGFALYLLISNLSSQWLRQPQSIILIYGGTLLLLLYLLFFGELIAGTRRWIDFGVISLQPAEFAKIVIILTTALIFGQRGQLVTRTTTKIATQASPRLIDRIRNLPIIKYLILSLLTVVPVVFLIFRQPSLGNALITTFLWLLILIALIPRTRYVIIYCIAGIIGFAFTTQLVAWPEGVSSFVRFLVLAIAAVSFGVVSYLYLYKSKIQLIIIAAIIALCALGGFIFENTWNHVLDDYQKDRITAFLDPESDPQGTGWQVQRAKIAIASAPLPFGFGFLQGPQTSSKYLPFPYTDFIFAAFTEQFGIFGALIILIIYFVLISRIILLVGEVPEVFGKLVLFGVAMMLTLNLVINIGMNIGIMPVTGVPLPLISYGGSSILVNMIALGLVQMIYTEQDLASGNAVKLYNLN